MRLRWVSLVGMLGLATATAAACGGSAFSIASDEGGVSSAPDASIDMALDGADSGASDGDEAGPTDGTAADRSETDAGPDALIGDGSPLDSGGDANAGHDAASEVATQDVNALDADAGGACLSKTVDETMGIFVALGGSTASNCGSRQSPCATVQTGLDRARAAGRTIVYVAHGVYTESISLYAGLHLQGGWEVIGTTWIPNCADPSGAVVVRAPLPRM